MNYDCLTAFQTPVELSKQVAKQLKEKRKRRKITQAQLSARAGVTLPSYKRFEQTGEISFLSLIKIAYALGCEDELRQLFVGNDYQSIQEVIDERDRKA